MLRYGQSNDTNWYYTPDTPASFQRLNAISNPSEPLTLALMLTLVNNTGTSSALPTGITVTFTDASGNNVAEPVTVNTESQSGWGESMTPVGQGGYGPTTGNQFNSGVGPSSLFYAGQTVYELITSATAQLPIQPNLSCTAQ